MALSVVIQKAISSGADFSILLEDDPRRVVRVRVTLKVGSLEETEFALTIAGVTSPSAKFHDVHVSGLQVAEITDWGDADPGTAIELRAVSAAGAVAHDRGVVV